MVVSSPLTRFSPNMKNRTIEVKELSTRQDTCDWLCPLYYHHFPHGGSISLHWRHHPMTAASGQDERENREDCIKLSDDNAALIQFCTRATLSGSMHDVLYGVYLRAHEWKALCHPFWISGTLPELISSFPAAHFSAFPSAPHPVQWLWCKAAAQKLLGVAKQLWFSSW